MTSLRDAAQQALAAMDYMLNNGEWYQAQERADALRAALAEPVQEPDPDPWGAGYEAGYAAGMKDYTAEPAQEPVAWQWLDTAHFRKKIPADATPSHWRPLYTAPLQCKPLTDEEIINIGKEARAVEGPHILPVAFARAIERAHGIGEP